MREPEAEPEEMYRPGVQAEAMHIQDGCLTHLGSLSWSLRGVKLAGLYSR